MAASYGNFGQPVFERPGAPKTSQGLEGPDKGFVGHFRGVLPGDMIMDNFRHVVLIFIQQSFEGIYIALQDIMDDGGIVGNVGGGTHFGKGRE